MVRFESPMGPILVEDPLYRVMSGAKEEKLRRSTSDFSRR